MKASVKEIQDSGKSIVLDDGSKWSISSFDAFNTRMWMRFDNIEINFNKLTNLREPLKTPIPRTDCLHPSDARHAPAPKCPEV